MVKLIVEDIYDQRGYKDEDHVLIRKAYEAELAKAMKELKTRMLYHSIYEKDIKREQEKMAREAEEEAKRLEQERLDNIETERREKLERESVAIKARRASKKQLTSQRRNHFRGKSLGKSEDTMGMNSPAKGKTRMLSDGTSTDDILVSQTKSFAAKIVASAV